LQKPVIIDCDPGHDDALALLLAGADRSLNVLGVTVIAGNQTLDKTTANTLKILEKANLSWPVYAGYAEPLLRKPVTAPEVHGETGLDGPELPEPVRSPEPQHAVEFLIEAVQTSSEPVTLIPTGPLTNVAAALLGAPSICDNIDKIVFMGGAAVGGNWSPAAEFNILVDPDAAHVVMQSSVEKTMIGLDVTEKALIYDSDIETIRELDNPVAITAAELLDFFAQYHRKKGLPGSPLHDPLAVAAVLKPDIVTAKRLPVKIERFGEYCLGRTVVDWYRDQYEDNNTQVALDMDRLQFMDMLLAALRSYG